MIKRPTEEEEEEEEAINSKTQHLQNAIVTLLLPEIQNDGAKEPHTLHNLKIMYQIKHGKSNC